MFGANKKSTIVCYNFENLIINKLNKLLFEIIYIRIEINRNLWGYIFLTQIYFKKTR